MAATALRPADDGIDQPGAEGTLRIATAGSVDDGKSTLIGRLLYDTKTVLADQLDAIDRTSRSRGDTHLDLALLTDGLRAEREQGITIDVAYRYFATGRRSFIMADTPGHVQYTRNMVTGASTADLAIVLVDARHGLTAQSRRHTFLASLLRVPHLVLAVNKMDLVGFSRSVFESVREEFERFATRLDVPDVTAVPISALHGDNVVQPSPRLDWFAGPTLLHHLETVHVNSDRNLVDVRFPVQYVIRPQSPDHPDYRGYAGRVAGGVLRAGAEVLHLPSGITTRVAGIDGTSGPLTEAYPPQSVTVRLTDDIDVSRGDMLCRPRNRPAATTRLDAMLCWMSATSSLRVGTSLQLKHTTRSVLCRVAELHYRIDIDVLRQDDTATSLALNEIGRVKLELAQPVFHDSYRRNRETGGFILIDPATNETVAAGMIND